MVNFCQKAILILKKNKKFEQIGKMLNENWNEKLSKNVTNKKLDNIYKIALKNGAIGGKIIGAGSGGFLFYVPKEKMRNFVKKMTFLKQVKFKPVYEGSRFIWLMKILIFPSTYITNYSNRNSRIALTYLKNIFTKFNLNFCKNSFILLNIIITRTSQWY